MPGSTSRVHLEGARFLGETRSLHRGEGLVLAEVTHQGERALPIHSHERAYFSLLLAGGYREDFDGRTIEYPRLGLGFHPAGSTHRDAIGPRGARFLTIVVGEPWLGAVAEGSGRLPGRTALQPPSSAFAAIGLLRRARAGGVHAGLGVESVVLELLARASDGSARAETRRPRWLDRVTEALEARPFQRWTIRRLAAEVGVHPVHLSRTFRRFERRGVGGLAREVRIRAACRLLLDERVPITDVSILAGFSDQSHFTRVFRAVTGLPPGELRRLLG